MTTQAIQEQNLGRAVKWQDIEGGWHTGKVVEYPTEGMYGGAFPKGEVEMELGYASLTKHYRLVKESCNGVLTWVERKLLQDWVDRSEWETQENVTQAKLCSGCNKPLTECTRQFPLCERQAEPLDHPLCLC